jgi:hypothetical protein
MAPKGLIGFLYWYGLYPFHGLIFRNLIRAITGIAEARATEDMSPALPDQVKT